MVEISRKQAHNGFLWALLAPIISIRWLAMVVQNRRDQLLERIRRRGFAALPDLAEALQVSESTVRRDLEYLEEMGQARRTHGGAFYTGESPEFPHFRDRQQTHWDKKRAIAVRAAALVEDGETPTAR